MWFDLMWIIIYILRPLYGLDIQTVDSIYGVIYLMGRDIVYPRVYSIYTTSCIWLNIHEIFVVVLYILDSY